jgi:hypothetical protein
MAKFQHGFTSHPPQTKDQLRKMLAEALRNSDHVDTVRVPENKRALSTRRKPVATPEIGEPMEATPAQEPTRGQKKRS